MSDIGILIRLRLTFVFDPCSTASTRLDQYRALIDLQKQGKVKHIDASNYGRSSIWRKSKQRDCRLPTPAVNQEVELHPLNTQNAVTRYMRENGIIPVAYSSLATMTMRSWRAKEGQGGDFKASEKAKAQAQEVQQNVSEAQLLLRRGLQRGYVILCKSATPS